jgi:hypothetical protein
VVPSRTSSTILSTGEEYGTITRACDRGFATTRRGQAIEGSSQSFLAKNWEGYSWRRLAACLGDCRRRTFPGYLAALVFVSIMLIAKGGSPANALEEFPPAKHALAPHGMPPFITAPGATDVLYVCVAIVLVAAVLAAGVFFFWLHSLPERMVHASTKVHFDIVAVLALLSLFTHIHWFWVAALLLALIKIPDMSFPDFSSLLGRIAGSIEKMADAESAKADTRADPRPRSAGPRKER